MNLQLIPIGMYNEVINALHYIYYNLFSQKP